MDAPHVVPRPRRNTSLTYVTYRLPSVRPTGGVSPRGRSGERRAGGHSVRNRADSRLPGAGRVTLVQTTRALLIATVGWGDLRVPANLPQPHNANLPGHPSAVDARAWARRLVSHFSRNPEGFLDALTLPRLAPVLLDPDMVGRAFDVVLIGTDQRHCTMRVTDTAPLAEFIAQMLPQWAQANGRSGLTAEAVALRADPADAEELWDCTAHLVERAEGYDTVHLAFFGGTPTLVGALVQRFAWARDDGRVQPTSWRLTPTGAAHDERLTVATRPGALKALMLLADEYAFPDVALAAHWSPAIAASAAKRIGGIARFGSLLLSLDVEDFPGNHLSVFEESAPAHALARQAGSLRFPDDPMAPREASALDSLVPLLRHCLEVLQVHWWRDEPTRVLAVLHLIAEYLAHLAWESAIGHPLDARRLASDLTGPDIRVGQPDCPMLEQRKSLALRVVAGHPLRSEQAWRRHLRSEYSYLGPLFGQCATPRPFHKFGSQISDACKNPCGVMTRLDDRVAHQLTDRIRLARAVSRSPLVQLRHPSPVGHFFGVPSRAELCEALGQTLKGLHGWNPAAAALPSGDEVADEQFVPDVAGIVAAVAGKPVEPGDLLARTRSLLLEEILVAGSGSGSSTDGLPTTSE